MLWLILVLICAYLLGSIPVGFLMVRLITGEDVRQMGSGRTGGTNTWRVAGRLPGAVTTALDGLKAAAGVWLAQAVLPSEWRYLGMALAGVCAILGHNYPIFLRFKGGAGGASCVGGAVGLWAPSIFIVLPIALVIWWGIGYASLATLSVSVVVTILFAVRAWLWPADAPWEYVLYGVGAIVLLAWALRPNFRRLMRGEERRFNPRAKRQV
jgi:acyl phosphate:glycerol-3-phosphate acyltransferase